MHTSLFKRYQQLLWQERGFALLGLVLAWLAALSAVALMATAGWLVGASALVGGSLVAAHTFNRSTAGMLIRGFSVSRTLGRYAERLATHEATFRVLAKLRSEMFQTLAQHHHSLERQMNSHQASSRLLEDIRHTEGLYLASLVPALVNLLVATLYLLLLGLLLPPALIVVMPLVLFALLGLPLLHLILLGESESQRQRLSGEIWSEASSIFNSLRTLTLFQRLGLQLDTLGEQTQQQGRFEQTSFRRQQLADLLLGLNQAAMLMVVIGFGFNAFVDQQIDGSALLAVFLMTLGVQEIFATASGAMTAGALGLKALKRIEALCSGEPIADSRQLRSGEVASLRFQGVDYQYPGAAAPCLSGFEHNFEKGWHWITGPSGAGKSTLMGLMQGRLQATNGEIRIIQPSENPIAVMPQRIEVLRGTLRYNLALHREVNDQQLMAALEQAQLSNWFASLPEGLDTWLGDGERMPSGGEMKRLAIARLLLQPADVVLLDEPTAGLDDTTSRAVIAALRNAWREHLVIIVTHDPNLIEPSEQRLQLG